MFSFITRKTRKFRVHLAAMNELQKQIFTALIHDSTLVTQILQGAALPHIWVASVLQLFPQAPEFQARLVAYVSLVARRLASALLQSSDRRDQLNRAIAEARNRQSLAAGELGGAKGALQANRNQVYRQAGAIAQKRNRQKTLQKRAVVAGALAGVCFVFAAATLAGETMSLASAFFATLTNPDFTQQFMVWSGCVTASLALGFLAERGIRPIFEEKGNVKICLTWGSPMGIALLLTLGLSALVAWLRLLGAGEGGLSDLPQFLFNLLTTPFLALVAGAWGALGVQQFKPLALLKQEMEALEAERADLDAVLEQMDVQEHDHGARQQRALAELASAKAAEQEAVAEKEQLLETILNSVTQSTEVRELTMDIASEAAEFAERRPVPPASGITTMLMVCALLPFLTGCNTYTNRAFGGTVPLCGVSVFIDQTGSVGGTTPFYQEVLDEFRVFMKEAPAGSHFEVWAMSASPGKPAAIYQFTAVKVLPRQRKAVRARAEQELRAALDRVPDPKSLKFSPVLEDSYRIAERLGSLPTQHRELVILSDLQQHSPTLRLTRILKEHDLQPLLDEVVQAYPPLTYRPDQVRLVTLPGMVGAGKVLTPAEKTHLKQFWSGLWTCWNAPDLSYTEPITLTGGKEKR